MVAWVSFYLVRYFHINSVSDIFSRTASPSIKTYKRNVKIHLYSNKQVNINSVLVRVYYVVASDRKNSVIKNWQNVFGGALSDVCQFYELQFGGNMKMNFEIYPKIIYSQKSSDYFISLTARDYNEELLKPHSSSSLLEDIIEELNHDIIERQWDLSKKRDDGTYIVNLIVLADGDNPMETKGGKILGLNDEGNNSLVFSAIFSDPKFSRYYKSVIAHEIGHGLGIPGFYTFYNDKVETSGVMGEGITRELRYNYLDSKIRREMESK